MIVSWLFEAERFIPNNVRKYEINVKCISILTSTVFIVLRITHDNGKVYGLYIMNTVCKI
jgi:hypothetical protein